MYNSWKRVFDLFFSALALILLFPVIIIIMLFIELIDGGPVFYVQKRVGENWKSFNLLKFRTMVNNLNSSDLGITIKNDSRLTKTGKILRKFKLDELPQLINVMKGEMSLIGPRPELHRYAEHYKEEYTEILKVKPGISDYASIKFKNENDLLLSKVNADDIYINIIMPQKLLLNQIYIREQGFFTDLKIIFLTIKHLYFTK